MEFDSHPGISEVTASLLWPPNHKMHDITINYTNGCNGSGDNACQILSVTSDEPLNTRGDGNTSFDWKIVDNHRVQLRSERKGNGDGRVYTITVRCIDALTCQPVIKTVKVGVPHDQSQSSVNNILSVIASPNPTTTQFTLNITNVNKKEKVKLAVVDAILGKVIGTRNNLNPNQTLQLGNKYKPGLYYLEVTQGSEKAVVKLIKQ